MAGQPCRKRAQFFIALAINRSSGSNALSLSKGSSVDVDCVTPAEIRMAYTAEYFVYILRRCDNNVYVGDVRKIRAALAAR